MKNAMKFGLVSSRVVREIFLLCCVAGICALAAMAEEEPTYVFERMWPTLPQWYWEDPFDFALDNSGNLYLTDVSRHTVMKFTTEGQFLTKWGGLGSEPGKFKSPNSLAVGPSGNVYVVDSGNHRIQAFTRHGQFTRAWGGEGDGNGEFSYPLGIATDSSGMIYVLDAGNGCIQVFSSEGDFERKWFVDEPGSALPSVGCQSGASPLQNDVATSVTDGNCVAARRGGEQPEVNDQSVG